MRTITKLAIGAVMVLSAATAAVAPAAAKSDSFCYDAYGYYGYSYAYCEHNVYGRSSPADRYYGQNRDWPWRSDQEFGRLADREQYSWQGHGDAMRDRDDHRHYDDRDLDRDEAKSSDRANLTEDRLFKTN